MLQAAVERCRLLSDIAKWYYLEGLSQREIAKRTSLSRPSVSRLLIEARRLSIVEIEINRPIPTASDLEAEIKDRFALQAAHVLERGTANDNEALRMLGCLGAVVLTGVLRDGMILGLTWGTAVQALVRALCPRRLTNVKVVQLLGGVGAPCIPGGSQLESLDGSEQVWRAAKLFGAKHYYLNAPLVVDNPGVAAALKQDHSIREVLEVAQHTHVAVLGIGSMVPELATICQAGYVSYEDLAELERRGAVGALCIFYLNMQGGRVCLPRVDDCVIGVSWEDLPRFGTTIAIAGGRRKAPAILAAIRSGIPAILVTDDAAAEGVLALCGGS